MLRYQAAVIAVVEIEQDLSSLGLGPLLPLSELHHRTGYSDKLRDHVSMGTSSAG